MLAGSLAGSRAFLVLVLAGAAAGCRDGAGVGGADRVVLGSVSRSVRALETFGGVRLRTSEGALTVRAGEGPNVEILAEVEGTEERRSELAGAPLVFDRHVKVRWEGPRLVVEDAHAGEPDAGEWRVSLHVTVPAVGPLDVEAKIGAGRISAHVPELGALALQGGAGDVVVEAERLLGPVTVELGSGSCHLAASTEAPVKDVSIDVGTGEIVLDLPDGASGEVDAVALVGELTADPRLGLTVERMLTRASAAGTLGAGGPTYRLRSAAGAIVLRRIGSTE